MSKKENGKKEKPINEMTVEELKTAIDSANEKCDALIKENEELIKENEQLKTESASHKDSYIRNVAEFDNYKKRNAHIYSDAYSDGKSDMLIKFLVIGDGIERALLTVKDENTLKGLNLLMKSFTDILKDANIEEINPEGEKFNPEFSEAVTQVQDETLEEDTIKTVFQKGYKLNGKVIRYAKVSVVK